jgi:hypothetical protein
MSALVVCVLERIAQALFMSGCQQTVHSWEATFMGAQAWLRRSHSEQAVPDPYSIFLWSVSTN